MPLHNHNAAYERLRGSRTFKLVSSATHQHLSLYSHHLGVILYLTQIACLFTSTITSFLQANIPLVYMPSWQGQSQNSCRRARVGTAFATYFGHISVSGLTHLPYVVLLSCFHIGDGLRFCFPTDSYLRKIFNPCSYFVFRQIPQKLDGSLPVTSNTRLLLADTPTPWILYRHRAVLGWYPHWFVFGARRGSANQPLDWP